MIRRVFVLCVVLLAAIGLVILPAAAQEEVTLVVWDNFTREAEQAMIEELNARFEEAHPGVTIQREVYSTDDITATLPLALSETTGPDVAMINQGSANMGALVGAGLLLPLNDYADQYDWWDRYGMGLHRRNMWSEDGTQFGGENLYGVSNWAEVVGVFYWKSDFEELGLEIPQTQEQFESVLMSLQEAGKTPIVFGSVEGWPAIHTLGAIQHAYSTREEVDAFTFGEEGGTYATEGNLTGAQKMVEWIDAGYFIPGFEGMDNDSATLGAFVNHEGSLWIAGSWMGGSISAELGEEEVGFFLMPPAEEGVAPLNIGGVALAYGIRATSEHHDLAAEYIDLVTGPEAAELLLQHGYIPAAEVDPEALIEGTLTADMVNAWNTISSEDAVGHYWDWTIPDIAAYIQELMAGQITPEEFIDRVEQDYTAE